MTRDDLYGHYRRYYVPNNATLVVVGDVDTDEVLRRVDHHFGAIASGTRPPRVRPVEPPQQAERRVHFRKQGTTAYWRAAFHAPAVSDADFFPMLFVDAALTGASGLNIWSGHKVPTPQRSARLYRTAVDTGLATNVGGAVLPTEHPFLYYIWATVAEGKTLAAVEDVILERARSRLARRDHRSRAHESAGAAARPLRLRRRQRHRHRPPARLLRDHRLVAGSISELIPRLAHVTLDQVNAAARKYLIPDNRTIGWFEPRKCTVHRSPFTVQFKVKSQGQCRSIRCV